jgi:hypothetical protein
VQKSHPRSLQEKAADLDRLIHLMKEKLKISDLYKTKIQILTLLTPESWSRRKAVPEIKCQNILFDTKSFVVNFFEDDEFSRLTVCRVKRTTLVFQVMYINSEDYSSVIVQCIVQSCTVHLIKKDIQMQKLGFQNFAA